MTVSGRLASRFKRSVYTILGTCCLTDELLQTTFCRLEHAFNLRPLLPVFVQSERLHVLQFFIRIVFYRYSVIVCSNELDSRKRCALAQSLAYAVWNKEYVPTLNQRSNWETFNDQHLRTLEWVRVVEETNPRFTTLPLGLEEFVTTPITQNAPPSYVRRTVHSLYQFFPRLLQGKDVSYN